MILINLLPHREARRKRRKAAFFAGLTLSGVIALAVSFVWYFSVQQLISGQKDRNEFLKSEIVKLDEQIKDIHSLRAQIDSLKARQKAVEDLQIDRNMPVHIFNDLVKQTPEGIYFTAIKQEGQLLSLNGISQSNDRVSEFLRNTSKNSEWLVKPELVEVKVATLASKQTDSKRLFEFSMRVSVKRPQDQAASAPEAGGSSPSAVPTPRVGASPSAAAPKV